MSPHGGGMWFFMIKYELTLNALPAIQLYNEISNENEILFKNLNNDEFTNIFSQDSSIHILAREGERIVGFASGNLDYVRACGYISYVGVKKEKRRLGIGRTLINMMVENFMSGGVAKKLECVFFCPAHLPWYIPGFFPHDHPCAPGVDILSPAYKFLLNLGFYEWTAQNSYYLNLNEFKISYKADQAMNRLSYDGIDITLYNPKCHHGLYNLFVNIGNMSWCEYVMKNVEKPIIVAVDKNEGGLVVAYTGPIETEVSGRGSFCGIGTHRDYRGKGIGKAVFFYMCEEQKKNGARFMSLYTGKENPARHIYESAGFQVVRTWANMRFDFKTV